MSLLMDITGDTYRIGLFVRKGPRLFSLIRCLAAVSTLLLLSMPGSVQGSEPAHQGVTEIEYGYPDQSIFVATMDTRGQLDSPMLRLAEVLMERAGIPWHAVSYPARRLFRNLESGNTNFSILVRGSSLEGSCIFSQQPVYTTQLNVYSIGNRPAVTSREDLIGKKIITIRGYSYAGLLKFISDPANRIVNEVTGTHTSAFAMLRDNRADYLLDYASAASDILAENPIEDLKANAIDELDIYLVLSRSYPDAENLMARLEAIVKTLDVDKILKGANGKY